MARADTEADDTIYATTVEGSAYESDKPALQIEPHASASGLAIGEVIGAGGMGVVRVALQRSLDRHVAVKTALPNAAPDTSELMLREAWVTGWLEHPGVVPIYDIVKDEASKPMVVMRRIQGTTWEDSISNEDWAQAEGARDLLERNLRVLVRICEIVEFAHDRGVLHRDIKPANVMLGSFGEVYLLDWGLALALDDAAAAHLPRASRAREPAGTFAYAAPEMVGASDSPLDRCTDVYLLGAVLFEIAAGEPPHHRSAMNAVLASIAASPPIVPERVPRRLASICTRAMARSPANRYQLVSELRHDVLAFLRSRDSERLSTAATTALAELRGACAAKDDRRRIYDLYGKCRFGFQEALRTWPANEVAAHGISATAETMIEHELARDPRAAGALLDEALVDVGVAVPEEGAGVAGRSSTRIAIHPPRLPGDLVERVRSALDAEAKERRGLSALAKEHDRHTGRPARTALFVGLGVVWAISQPLADRVGPQVHMRFAIGSLVQLPFLGLALVVWPDLRRVTFNRRLLAAAATFVIAQSSLYVVGSAYGVALAPLRALSVGLGALTAASLMVFQESRVWPMTLGLCAALAASVVWPEQRAVFAGLGALGVTANLALVWGRDRKE